MGHLYAIAHEQGVTILAATDVAQPLTTEVIRGVESVGIQAMLENSEVIAVGTLRRRVEAVENIAGATVRVKSTAHGLIAGDRVTFVGVVGLTGFNTTYTVVADATDTVNWFVVAFSIGAETYKSGGAWTFVSRTASHIKGFQLLSGGTQEFRHVMPHQVYIIGKIGEGVLWNVERSGSGKVGTHP